MIVGAIVKHLSLGRDETIQIGVSRKAAVPVVLLVCTFLVMGCQHPPPLGDARIDDIRLATADDMTRLQRAEDKLRRQVFRGEIIHDQKLGVITFSRYDFDQADRYAREHHRSSYPFAGALRPGPRLRLSFQTRRMLVDSGDDNTVYTADASLALCDHPEMKVGEATLMWNGWFVSSPLLPDIKRSIASDHKPQEYEIMIPVSSRARAVTLMRPPGDLCLALYEHDWPFHDTYGRGLRIDWWVVSAALLPLADYRSIPRGIGSE